MSLARARPILSLARHPASRRYASSTPAVVTEEEDPQIAGYPRVPAVNRQHLSPYGWDDPLERRNFNEPLHPQAELLSMWGPDVPPVAPKTALMRFAIATVCFVGAGVAIKTMLVPEKRAVPRQYPYSGLVTELGGVEQNKAQEESVAEDEE